MSKNKYPSIDYVRQCFREDNGHLFWLERPLEHFASIGSWKTWNKRFSGKEAGHIATSGREHSGYRVVVVINGVIRYRYLIIWALHHGEWTLRLDHKNRDSMDDRIDNLRPATPLQNVANSTICRDNKSGFKGVTWFKPARKWRASMTVNNKHVSLGYFDDPVKAHEAYVKAAKERYGEFACDGTPRKIE